MLWLSRRHDCACGHCRVALLYGQQSCQHQNEHVDGSTHAAVCLPADMSSAPMQISPSDLQSSRMRQGKEWEDGGWCDVTNSQYNRSRHLLWKEGELLVRLLDICCLLADELKNSWPCASPRRGEQSTSRTARKIIWLVDQSF